MKSIRNLSNWVLCRDIAVCFGAIVAGLPLGVCVLLLLSLLLGCIISILCENEARGEAEPPTAKQINTALEYLKEDIQDALQEHRQELTREMMQSQEKANLALKVALLTPSEAARRDLHTFYVEELLRSRAAAAAKGSSPVVEEKPDDAAAVTHVSIVASDTYKSGAT